MVRRKITPSKGGMGQGSVLTRKAAKHAKAVEEQQAAKEQEMPEEQQAAKETRKGRGEPPASRSGKHIFYSDVS